MDEIYHKEKTINEVGILWRPSFLSKGLRHPRSLTSKELPL